MQSIMLLTFTSYIFSSHRICWYGNSNAGGADVSFLEDPSIDVSIEASPNMGWGTVAHNFCGSYEYNMLIWYLIRDSTQP